MVIVETLNYLARHAGCRAASHCAASLYSSQVLQILRPVLDDELTAVQFLEKYADQKVGFTDCVSFVLMKRERIKRVFTFDRHFGYAEFEIVP